MSGPIAAALAVLIVSTFSCRSARVAPDVEYYPLTGAMARQACV